MIVLSEDLFMNLNYRKSIRFLRLRPFSLRDFCTFKIYCLLLIFFFGMTGPLQYYYLEYVLPIVEGRLEADITMGNFQDLQSLVLVRLTIPGVTLPPCRGLWGTLHIWGRY